MKIYCMREQLHTRERGYTDLLYGHNPHTKQTAVIMFDKQFTVNRVLQPLNKNTIQFNIDNESDNTVDRIRAVSVFTYTALIR